MSNSVNLSNIKIILSNGDYWGNSIVSIDERFENNNFTNIGNKVFGYLNQYYKNGHSATHIEKLDPNSKGKDWLDNCIVIFFSKKSNNKIAGFYWDAKVYRHKQILENGDIYYCEASSKNVFDIKDKEIKLNEISQFKNSKFSGQWKVLYLSMYHIPKTFSHKNIEDIYKWVLETKNNLQQRKFNLNYDILHLENEKDSKEVSQILNDNNLKSTDKETLLKSRLGQGKYRDSLIAKYKKCLLSNVDNMHLLRASHILPWKEANNFERLDSHNGLLLLSSIDCLFDKYLISFDEKGFLKYNQRECNKELLMKIGISAEYLNNKKSLFDSPLISNETKKYLFNHHQKFILNNKNNKL